MEKLRGQLDIILNQYLLPRLPPWVTPNGITMARLVGILFIAGFYYWGLAMVALAAYLATALTDYLDGWLARARQQFSPWGKLWDERADKLLVLALVSLFFLDGKIEAKWRDPLLWAVVLTLFRESLITVLRKWGWVRNSKPLLSARLKTTVQMVGVGILIVGSHQANDMMSYGLYLVGGLVLWVSVGLGWYSGYYYIRGEAD